MNIGLQHSKLNKHSLLLDAAISEEDKPLFYKNLVNECYIIGKNMNMSYVDVLKISPTERMMLKQCLLEEAKQHKEYIEKIKAERESKKH